MGNMIKMGVIVLLATMNLWARDSDTKKNVSVQPGWTYAKAIFAEDWNSMSTEKRTDYINAFSDRLNALKADVTDFKSDPKAEDGGEAFYPAVYKMISALKSNPKRAELAAKINEMLAQAERTVKYRKSHPFTGKGPLVINAPFSENGSGGYTPIDAGTGWLSAWVQDSAGDNGTNPVVCQAGNYLFAAIESGVSQDKLNIYKSTDHGRSWYYWTSTYMTGESIYPGAIAYDIQNNALVISARVSYKNGNILFLRYNDINDSTNWNYTWVTDTTDLLGQPQLSVEYTYTGDRICIYYHNNTTQNDVIARSTDHGDTWSTVFTSAWTGGWEGAPKAAQGNNGGTGADAFLFVTSLPDTYKLTVTASASGAVGAWRTTELADPYNRIANDADISGSHSTAKHGAMVVYEAQYPTGARSIRGWWSANAIDSAYYHFFVDDANSSDSLSSPRVSTDGEWTNEVPPQSDYYHIAYFADINLDGNYRIIARRVNNNWSDISAASDSFLATAYNEYWLGDSLGMLTANAIWDYGYPASWYQIDNTTFSTQNDTTPYATSIVWREDLSSNSIILSSTMDITADISEQRPADGQSTQFTAKAFSGRNPRLSIVLPDAGEVSLRVYDTKGALVKNFSGNYRKGINDFIIQPSVTGAFFAVVKYGDKTKTLKFVYIR